MASNPEDIKRLKVSFSLWIDHTKYRDPRTWDFNEIFGFNVSLKEDGARITMVEVEDTPMRFSDRINRAN